MRQFSISTLFWFTAATGLSIAANLYSRTYELMVFQPVDSPLIFRERGFPLSYVEPGTPWCWQVFWIVLNASIVFLLVYLLLRFAKLMRQVLNRPATAP